MGGMDVKEIASRLTLAPGVVQQFVDEQAKASDSDEDEDVERCNHARGIADFARARKASPCRSSAVAAWRAE